MYYHCNSIFIQDLQRGYTPNPDIVCNEKIKFGVLQKYIVNKMGVSLMATGHYARIHKRHDGQLAHSERVRETYMYLIAVLCTAQ